MRPRPSAMRTAIRASTAGLALVAGLATLAACTSAPQTIGFTDSGVPAGKIDTVSFGEAKPAVQGHDESAWKWNRRGEFVVRR